jgi:hypothetical protein
MADDIDTPLIAAAEPEAAPPAPASEPVREAVGDAPGDAAEIAPQEPVSYANLVLPDGVEIDQAALENAQALFAEARLSQPQAQKLVDLYAGRMSELARRQTEAAERRQAGWVAEVKADPELGGARLDAARAFARRALGRFGAPGLGQVLDELAVSNNPQLFRFFVAVGKSISEDSWAGSRASAPRPSAAEILYPPAPIDDE